VSDKPIEATEQHGGPKDKQRDTQRDDVGGDEDHSRVKTPTKKEDEQFPGMGEDEDKNYLPEKQRP
jgi:hypothetical protein